MKEEEKQLLLQDLCARLPYDVCVHIRYKTGEPCYGKLTLKDIQWFIDSKIENIKPYLRPMSSMTEDELNECVQQSGIREVECPNWHDLPKEKQSEARLKHSMNMFLVDSRTIDWLNKKMFDCRGLIPMGLALEAPEEMYEIVPSSI